MDKEKKGASQDPPFWKKLGPGLITGAADDDPSGIATYSQVGAGFGYGMLWTTFFTFPLMVGIQVVSARIGRVTGHGLAANIRKHYNPWLLRGIISLLLVANTINIAADIGAMAAALKLLIGGSPHLYAIMFGVLSLALQIFIPFPRYLPNLENADVIPFRLCGDGVYRPSAMGRGTKHTVMPSISIKTEYVVAVVAVFGTTISPYLFSGKPLRKSRSCVLSTATSR